MNNYIFYKDVYLNDAICDYLCKDWNNDMKPRISYKGKVLLRSNAASRSLMKALVAELGTPRIDNGNTVKFDIKVNGTTRKVGVKKTLTLSDLLKHV